MKIQTNMICWKLFSRLSQYVKIYIIMLCTLEIKIPFCREIEKTITTTNLNYEQLKIIHHWNVRISFSALQFYFQVKEFLIFDFFPLSSVRIVPDTNINDLWLMNCLSMGSIEHFKQTKNGISFYTQEFCECVCVWMWTCYFPLFSIISFSVIAFHGLLRPFFCWIQEI